MALVMDPVGEEIRALRKITNWRGKHVLEIGCGDGRLTLRLAKFGVEKILAFDPDPQAIRAARKELPEKYQSHVEYRAGNAEHVKQKEQRFDIVVFSWVL